MNVFFLSLLLTLSAWISPLSDWGMRGEVYFENSVYRVDVEVAYFDYQKQLGLMFRQDLPLFKGMIFLYQKPQKLSFWMKNTLIPLEIIFIDKDFKVSDYFYMEPLNERKIYYSPGKDIMALEITPQTFQKLSLQRGEKVSLDFFLYYRFLGLTLFEEKVN